MALLLVLVFLGLLALAQAFVVGHDCRQIELSFQKRLQVPANAACEQFINLAQMRAQMTQRLIWYNSNPDRCQGDDGFGPYSSICMVEVDTCPTNGICRYKTCICSVTWKAWRVHKEDQLGVSCAVGDYATRITGQVFIPPDAPVNRFVSVAAVSSNDNVHCGHRR